MSELNVELVGKQKNWTFTREEVRVGRDPSCDLAVPSDDYPMVSGRHLRIRFEGGEYWVEDLESRNGTFLNGRSVRREKLSPGDSLRLGADGPELRVQFEPVPTGAPTRAPGTAPGVVGPTQPGQREPLPTRPPATAPPPARPPTPSTAPTPAKGPPSKPPPTPQAAMEEELSPGEEAMIEQRLNTLRNLLVVALGLILALGAVIVYQAQQINRNHDAIQDMRSEARTAVGQFMPDLEKRLSTFETSMGEMQTAMEGMDEKIKQAEDRMVRRLEREMPRILDAYLEKKLEEMRQEAARRPGR
ncbi:MAG: FHA domain-containing protein [Candidatus Acidoferrales bacterium]